MDIFDFSQKMMTMSEESWARHANPRSVYTRFTCLPLLSLAIWSRGMLGYYAIPLILLALLWIWYNPRAFSPPETTDNWASKGTFGERIFLRKKDLDIPEHHVRMAHLLTWLTASGMPILIYGLIALNPWAIILGNFVVILPKVWFVDRMNWIYEDMKDTQPEFSSWLKS